MELLDHVRTVLGLVQANTIMYTDEIMTPNWQ